MANIRAANVRQNDRDARFELFALVRKQWWLVAGALLAGSLAALFYSLGQTKIYRAAATVQIDPTPPKPLGANVQGVADVGTGVYWNTREYYQTQYQILKSRSLALETVERLGLHLDPTFLANKPRGEAVPDAPPDEEKARQALQERLGVTPFKDSRLVEVSLEDADPERAVRVLRTLVVGYLDENVDGVIQSTNTAAEWLGVQLEKLRMELDERELALHSFKKDQQILSVSMDDQSNMLRDEMTQLNQSLTRVRTEQEGLAARSAQLNEVSIEDLDRLPNAELLEDPVLQRLRGDYQRAREEHATLLAAGKGDQHPAALVAAAKLAEASRAMLAEVENIRGARKRALAAKRNEEQGLRKLYENAKARALELNRLALEYNRLERAKVNTEKVYALVLERSKESDLTRFMRFNNIRVVDDAFVAEKPVRPRTALNVLVGGFLGLALGLFAAFGRGALDTTLRRPEEVEPALGLALLGILPRVTELGTRRAGLESAAGGAQMSELLVNDQPNSNVAEAARALRTSLMLVNPDKPHVTLLVTSAAPEEGKTMVACSIALAMAQTGKRVILVDCDMRRPRLHTIFRRDNAVGLSTLIMDARSLDSMDLTTHVPHLSMLTSGPTAPNPAELLQSERFGALLADLAKRYDKVVIDSPPVVPVTDATILSTRAQATVLVVRADKTPRDTAQRAARTLADVSANVLGVVFNALDVSRRGYGTYRYYQGYGVPGQALGVPRQLANARELDATPTQGS